MSDATKRLINAAEWVVTIFTDATLAHERGNLDDWLHELNEAILKIEKEQQSIPIAWHCANDIIGKHFFTTEWSQVEQLTESKNAAKWKITPLVSL